MEDLASQRACMAGEWNMPGHKLTGLRFEEPASMGTDVVGFVSVESVERLFDGTRKGGIGERELGVILNLERW